MTLGGEGGMITTNNSSLFNFCRSFNNHGKDLKKYYSNQSLKSFPYIHDSIGSNYRLTEMQSALGLHQLDLLPSWHKKRSANAKIYMQSIQGLEIIQKPVVPENYTHAWYKLYLTLQPGKIKKSFDRNKIIKQLNNLNVPVGFGGSGEMYREKAFSSLNQGLGSRLANGKFLEQNSLMLLVHPTIAIKESKRRAETLAKILKNAHK